MHKKSHHAPSLEILMGGLQVFLVKKSIWDGGEINFHARILIPVFKVTELLEKLCSHIVLM